MGLDKFPYRSLGIVSDTPRPVREEIFGHVLDDGVKDHTVATSRSHWSVSLQFFKYVIAGVVAVKTYETKVEFSVEEQLD